jgi:hypothetical protein
MFNIPPLGPTQYVGATTLTKGPVSIDVAPSGTRTWAGVLLDYLGDNAAPYSPSLAKVLWSQSAATLLTGAVIVALMVAIEKKL